MADYKGVFWASYKPSEAKCTVQTGVSHKTKKTLKCNGLTATHTNLAGAAGDKGGTTIYFKQGKGQCAVDLLGFLVCGDKPYLQSVERIKKRGGR